MTPIPQARTRFRANVTLARLILGVPILLGGSLATSPAWAEGPLPLPPADAGLSAASDPARKPVTLDLRNVPVRAALRALFLASGRPSYEVDPDVRGIVNAEATGTPFDATLRQIVDSVQPPLDFTSEGGTYRISVKRATPPPPLAVGPSALSGADGPGMQAQAAAEGVAARPQRFYRIPVDSYDASYIASLLNARGITKVGINEVIPASGTGSGQAGGGQVGGGQGGGQTGGFGGGGRGGGRPTGY